MTFADDGEIVWEDPTPRTVPVRWADRLTPLMGRPNEWARLRICPRRETARSTARNLTQGSVTLPDGTSNVDWEFTSRKLPDGSGAVYGRYLAVTDEAYARSAVRVREILDGREAKAGMWQDMLDTTADAPSAVNTIQGKP